MEDGNPRDTYALRLCSYLWEEYRYRHDLIWQRTFRFTIAVVALSVIPYVQRDIACLLDPVILLAPLLAVILACFVLVVMWRELEAFDRIKGAYRREQDKLLGDTDENEERKSYFAHLVRAYLIALAALSVVNGFCVQLVWLRNLC